MTANTEQRGASHTYGQWFTPAVSYVEPLRLACELCGRPIARRFWQARIDGAERTFCEPAHADLYLTYWLPTHGSSDRSSGAAPRS